MSLLSSIQHTFYNIALKKYLRNAASKSKMNLGLSKNIAVILDVSEGLHTPINKAALTLVTKMKDLKKNVRLLAYSADVKNPEFTDFSELKCFCKKDLNWALVPKEKQVGEFLNEKYDILFAMFLNEAKPLDFILSASSAHLKVGYYQPEKTEKLDLMVHNSQNNFNKGNDQMLELLSKIND
jgi:hypothetical protein